MRFKLLLKLELKKTLKKFPQIIFGAIALILLISAVAFCSNKYLYKLPVNTNINIALAVEDNSFLMNLFMNTIQNSDSFSNVSTFVPCSRDEIPQLLDNGDAIAGIIISETVTDDIMTGKNTPIEIVFPANSGFEAAILSEITKSIATMLSSAQSSVHCGIDLYKAYNAPGRSEMVERLNSKNISVVLFRDSAFLESYVSATGSLSSANYYITSGLLVFLLLFAINIASIYTHYHSHLEARLSQNGIAPFMQLIIKYLSILLIYILLLPILLIFLTTVVKPLVVLKLIIPLIICITCLSALSLFIYEIFRKTVPCILFIFLFSIFLAFISGCFIPSLMLPDSINMFASFLPTTYILSIISNTFINEFAILPYIIVIAFSLIFILFTYSIKTLRTKLQN